MAAGHQDTFHHVRDFPFFELPFGLELQLPEIFGFQLTRYMLVQVVAGLLTLVIFRGLAKRIRDGSPAHSRWWNFWEILALFIRDEVVRPTIGHDHEEHVGHEHEDYVDPAGLVHYEEPEVGKEDRAKWRLQEIEPTGGHPADKFLPFVWSCFFYILWCNLLGLVGVIGSPTANLNVTGPLALVAFAYVILNGSKAMGPVGFWKHQVPDMGLSGPLKYVLVPMVWIIEVVGLVIKHCVLAVRLFANIMAGHTALGVLLAFIAADAVIGSWLLWPSVTLASVVGQGVISLLELLFAFIQAYVFAFLATVFISMALHPH